MNEIKKGWNAALTHDHFKPKIIAVALKMAKIFNFESLKKKRKKIFFSGHRNCKKKITIEKSIQYLPALHFIFSVSPCFEFYFFSISLLWIIYFISLLWKPVELPHFENQLICQIFMDIKVKRIKYLSSPSCSKTVFGDIK